MNHEKLEAFLLGAVSKRAKAAARMLADTVYDVGEYTDERIAFEEMAIQLFMHNLTKISNTAYDMGFEEGKPKNRIEFTDATNLCHALETSMPGVNVKRALN